MIYSPQTYNKHGPIVATQHMKDAISMPTDVTYNFMCDLKTDISHYLPNDYEIYTSLYYTCRIITWLDKRVGKGCLWKPSAAKQGFCFSKMTGRNRF